MHHANLSVVHWTMHDDGVPMQQKDTRTEISRSLRRPARRSHDNGLSLGPTAGVHRRRRFRISQTPGDATGPVDASRVRRGCGLRSGRLGSANLLDRNTPISRGGVSPTNGCSLVTTPRDRCGGWDVAVAPTSPGWKDPRLPAVVQEISIDRCVAPLADLRRRFGMRPPVSLMNHVCSAFGTIATVHSPIGGNRPLFRHTVSPTDCNVSRNRSAGIYQTAATEPMRDQSTGT